MNLPVDGYFSSRYNTKHLASQGFLALFYNKATHKNLDGSKKTYQLG